jgi:ribonucleoside-triphosphate reductase
MFQTIKRKNLPAFSKWAIYTLALAFSLGLGYLLLTGSRWSQLIGYFAYMSVATSLIPLPLLPYVIALGKVFDPGLVALIGTLGNCLAAFVEYHLLTWFFSKSELEQRLQANPSYQKFSHYFERAVFPCLLISALTPIPFEPFRLAAILIRYNITLYLLAIFIGRLPRYYIMAQLGHFFVIPNSYLIALLLVLLLLPIIVLWSQKGKKRQRQRPALTPPSPRPHPPAPSPNFRGAEGESKYIDFWG